MREVKLSPETMYCDSDTAQLGAWQLDAVVLLLCCLRTERSLSLHAITDN